jgi:hypothetical protein
MKHELQIGGVWNIVTSPYLSSCESSSSNCSLIPIDLIGSFAMVCACSNAS